jgi:ABC-type multidrug transport system ATPase subunit
MIELTDVVRSYSGPWYRGSRPIRALDGVSLRVHPGEAVGVVGLNGAGKSTLLRVVLGYTRPSEGTASIGGAPPRRYVENNGIAYVPERIAIPHHWSVRSAVRTYAMLGNLGDDAWSQVDGAIDRLGLTSLAERRVGTLSKGNLQRVGIAQALLGNRRIMVLDEPTDGLDPIWMAELRSVVMDWRHARPDRSVILASHNLPEVERLTDRVVLLHNGRVQGEFQPSPDGMGLEERFIARVGELEEARP